MSSIIAADDQINQAMMRGILDAFRTELKIQLQAESNIIIERTVDELSKRIKLKLDSEEDFLRDRKSIHLTWCIKTENSRGAV